MVGLDGAPKPPAQLRRKTQRRGERAMMNRNVRDTLAEDVTLEGGALARPIVGRNRVKHVMGVASKIFEALAFTQQTESGARTYLEWQAKAFGGESFAGVTVLTKNEKGLIDREPCRPDGA